MMTPLGWWYRRLRRIDTEILWPACLKQTQGDRDRARAAFAVHARQDKAWRYLGPDETYRQIDALGGKP